MFTLGPSNSVTSNYHFHSSCICVPVYVFTHACMTHTKTCEKKKIVCVHVFNMCRMHNPITIEPTLVPKYFFTNSMLGAHIWLGETDFPNKYSAMQKHPARVLPRLMQSVFNLGLHILIRTQCIRPHRNSCVFTL